MKQFVCSVLMLTVISMVLGTRITLDDDAMEMCKKYKMMCKTGKVCAVQHFDWPKNISIPVCIPLSFVPPEYSQVRNAYCQLPADPGRCHARYIRWYFKSDAGECTHFQYGGCDGNQNNFMSKRECEMTCMATPTIRLFDDNPPVVIAQPVYDTQRDSKFSYEALNSVQEEPKPAHTFDRYQVGRQKNNRMRNDEANTRTRRRLDKEDKERKRKERERKREKKRLRKLMKKELRRKIRLEQKEKEREEQRKKKDVMLEQPIDSKNEITSKKNKKNTADLAKETKTMITEKLQTQTDKEKRREERRKERRRQKRREKKRKRREREGQRQLAKLAEDTDVVEEPLSDLVTVPKLDTAPQLGPKADQGKDTTNPKGSESRLS